MMVNSKQNFKKVKIEKEKRKTLREEKLANALKKNIKLRKQ